MKLKPSALEWIGDRGLIIRFDALPSHELTMYLVGLAKALKKFPGVVDAAVGHQTVLAEGPLRALEEAARKLDTFAAQIEISDGRLFEVPLAYDGEDLEWLCDHLHISKEKLISVHSKDPYQVRLIGSPGFIYLSEVDPMIRSPRLDVPRQNVAQGSVGIGGRQTGIYGRPRPGGWRLIATMETIPEVLPGDRIRFIPS